MLFSLGSHYKTQEYDLFTSDSAELHAYLFYINVTTTSLTSLPVAPNPLTSATPACHPHASTYRAMTPALPAPCLDISGRLTFLASGLQACRAPLNRLTLASAGLFLWRRQGACVCRSLPRIPPPPQRRCRWLLWNVCSPAG